MSERVPPLAGLPETVNGKSLAWAQGNLEREQCVSCGVLQVIREDVQAILCGRCSLILSQGTVHMPKPRQTTLLFQAKNRRGRVRRNLVG